MKKNKKILITGATGFIGSYITELFVKKGFKVKAFDRYNPNYQLNCLEKSFYKKDIEFIFGDIRDYDSVNKAAKGQDIIIHLAALIGIPYSYSSPIAYVKTNVEGTYNILECAKTHNISEILVTSTSENYGTAQYVPIDEKHPLVAQSPYAASKISADQLALSYYNSFNLPIKIVRPFNNFGPRQSPRAVIPTIINQAINSKFIKLGNIKPKRDYVYVEDTAEAFYQILLKKKFFGKVVNVGTGQEHSIKSIVQSIQKILGTNKKVLIDKSRVRHKFTEVDRLKCNNNFLKKNTSWKTSDSFNNHLKKTIKWFQANNNKELSKIYNI